MKKGYRFCIKLSFGGFGLINGYDSLEDALFEFEKTGCHQGRRYVIIDENNKILYDGEDYWNTENGGK